MSSMALMPDIGIAAPGLTVGAAMRARMRMLMRRRVVLLRVAVYLSRHRSRIRQSQRGR
jgi:hypothetical protein